MKSKNLMIATALMVISIGCTKTPEACFTADKGKTAKVNEEVQFDASCSSNAKSYTWDFGDGSTGTGVSTKHKFSVAKDYVITLTVSNKNKSETLTQNLTIAP